MHRGAKSAKAQILGDMAQGKLKKKNHAEMG
jgi:hypothetical protein